MGILILIPFALSILVVMQTLRALVFASRREKMIANFATQFGEVLTPLRFYMMLAATSGFLLLAIWSVWSVLVWVFG